MKKRFLAQSALLALTLAAGLAAAQPALAAEKTEPVDLDSITSNLSINYSKLQVQPLSGWYTETVSEGRTIKVYIPENTELRGRFNVIAVPDGVDTWDFLEEQGWIDKAEAAKEALFVLEPGSEGWGTAEEESSYISAGMAVLTSQTNHNKISVFNTFGTFAAIGYDKGCAPLEAWVIDHPLHIYSQVYFNGESAGEQYMEAARNYVYDENFPGSKVITADQFQTAMTAMGYTLEDAGTKADVAIPTWFVGYAEDDASIAYWKTANDVLPGQDQDGTFHQSIDSDAWQTLYANSNIKKWNPDTTFGISEVRVTDTADIDAVYDFISSYTNYTTLCSYSNNLAPRMDYNEVVNKATADAEKGAVASVPYTDYDGNEAAAYIYEFSSQRVSYDRCSVEGTMYAGAIATQDYNDDGIQDPREVLVYVPDSAAQYGENGAPMVLVNPGSLQTAVTFADCSGWIPIANDEGCILVIINQPYASATTVRYDQASTGYILKDDFETANFSRGVMSYMKNVFSGSYADIDFTRVYASGHSAGSNASEQLGLVSDSNWLAAIGSTSFITRNENLSEGYMPTYLMVGQTDINDYRVDMVSEPYVSEPTVEGAGCLYTWLNLVLAKNKIDVTIKADDRDAYLASCSKIEDQTRFVTYTWANDQGIELVKFGRTSLREHNCYPEEFRYAWEFMKHFNVVDNGDGTVSRYYSESAFTENDWIELGVKKEQTISAAKTSYTVSCGASSVKLNVKGAKGALSYSSSNEDVVLVGTNGRIAFVGAGSAVITVKAAETSLYAESNTLKIKVKVVKKDQSLKVKTGSQTLKASKVKKEKQSFRMSVSGAKGNLSYKKTSGSSKITVSSSGKITVAKGTKAGTYKIKVKTIAAATDTYNKAAVSTTITIKVK